MEEQKYISVGEMAKYLNKTPQHVYNLIHEGSIHAMEFTRGTMRGWLCLKPADYDMWKERNAIVV